MVSSYAESTRRAVAAPMSTSTTLSHARRATSAPRSRRRRPSSSSAAGRGGAPSSARRATQRVCSLRALADRAPRRTLDCANGTSETCDLSGSPQSLTRGEG